MTDIEKLNTLYGKPLKARFLRDGDNFVVEEFFIKHIRLKDYYRIMRMRPAESLSLIQLCTDLTAEQIGMMHPNDLNDVFTECILLNSNNIFNAETHKKNSTFKLEYLKVKQEVLADMVARAGILVGKTFQEILNEYSFEQLILTFEANIRSKTIEGSLASKSIEESIISTSWAKESAKKSVLSQIGKHKKEAVNFGLNRSY